VLTTNDPLQAKALERMKVKRFSGRSQDWENFEFEFMQYLRLVQDVNPAAALSTRGVMATLSEHLDEASVTLLRSEIRKNKNVNFYQFWDMLKSTHVKNARQVNRQNWKAVHLRKAGKEPTFMEWRLFRAEYEEKRQLVDDWTDHEDYAQIMHQLTERLRQKVTSEQTKMRRGRRHVAISCQVDDVAQQVKAELERQHRLELPIVKADRRSLTIDCTDEATMNLLLEYDTGDWHGTPIKVTRADYVMTGNEILELITTHLEGLAEADQWAPEEEEVHDHDHEDRFLPRHDFNSEWRKRGKGRVYATKGETKGGNKGKGQPPSPRKTDNTPQRQGKGGYNSDRNAGKGDRQQQQWWTEVRYERKGKGKQSTSSPRQYNSQGYPPANSGKGSSGNDCRRESERPPSPRGQAPRRRPEDFHVGMCGYCLDHGQDYHHHFYNCKNRLDRVFGPSGERKPAGPPRDSPQQSSAESHGSRGADGTPPPRAQ